jgi:hypothetical protein
MKHLISASLLICVGTFVTWLTASLIEYNALDRARAPQVSFVEPAAPTNTWGLAQAPAKVAVGRERARITTAAVLN